MGQLTVKEEETRLKSKLGRFNSFREVAIAQYRASATLGWGLYGQYFDIATVQTILSLLGAADASGTAPYSLFQIVMEDWGTRCRRMDLRHCVPAMHAEQMLQPFVTGSMGIDEALAAIQRLRANASYVEWTPPAKALSTLWRLTQRNSETAASLDNAGALDVQEITWEHYTSFIDRMRQVPGDACRLTLNQGGLQRDRVRGEQAQGAPPRNDTHQSRGTINKAPKTHRQLAMGAAAQANALAAQGKASPVGGCWSCGGEHFASECTANDQQIARYKATLKTQGGNNSPTQQGQLERGERRSFQLKEFDKGKKKAGGRVVMAHAFMAILTVAAGSTFAEDTSGSETQSKHWPSEDDDLPDRAARRRRGLRGRAPDDRRRGDPGGLAHRAHDYRRVWSHAAGAGARHARTRAKPAGCRAQHRAHHAGSRSRRCRRGKAPGTRRRTCGQSWKRFARLRRSRSTWPSWPRSTSASSTSAASTSIRPRRRMTKTWRRRSRSARSTLSLLEAENAKWPPYNAAQFVSGHNAGQGTTLAGHSSPNAFQIWKMFARTRSSRSRPSWPSWPRTTVASSTSDARASTGWRRRMTKTSRRRSR
jgi:hypothetical protein